MDINKFLDRALEIKKKFSGLEKIVCGREWTREEVLQGFVVDVGDLVKLDMAKRGIREVEGVDEKLSHELIDCLWCILVLSKMYNVDLEKSFPRVMDDLEKKVDERIKKLKK